MPKALSQKYIHACGIRMSVRIAIQACVSTFIGDDLASYRQRLKEESRHPRIYASQKLDISESKLPIQDYT